MTETFQNAHVVVTGVAGFIGSHLAEVLLKKGAFVIGVDNFISGQKSNLKHLADHENFTFVEADVSSAPSSYLSTFHQIDYILHFASPASPPRYQQYPRETYRVNTVGTDQLLEFLKERFPMAVFLYASTSEIYGDPQVHPQTEDYWGNVNPNGVRSCYDEAKRLGETICGVFERNFDMDVRIIRIFNTYGPRIDREDGRVIPNFISQALNHQPLTIYGDGGQTRSFCYVDDLVQAILAFAVHSEGRGKTINLGNPVEMTMLEVIKVLETLMGYPLDLVYKDLPLDDPTRRKPDITQAQKLLNWTPATSLEDGLAKTIAYFKETYTL